MGLGPGEGTGSAVADLNLLGWWIPPTGGHKEVQRTLDVVQKRTGDRRYGERHRHGDGYDTGAKDDLPRVRAYGKCHAGIHNGGDGLWRHPAAVTTSNPGHGKPIVVRSGCGREAEVRSEEHT